jgi:hypothetical protein
MVKKIKIHFTNKNIGGNKDVFNIFNEQQLNSNYKISSISLLKMFETMFAKKNKSNNSKDIYIKGSETKKYYEKIKKK